MSRKIASHIINEKYKKNFFHFVNEFRIKEAIKILENPKYAHLKMEAISQSVGFLSRSTFNQAFKEFMGTTPAEYRRMKLYL